MVPCWKSFHVIYIVVKNGASAGYILVDPASSRIIDRFKNELIRKYSFFLCEKACYVCLDLKLLK